MAPTLKKLRDQVIVITGATSGVGLVTARQAARRGARLVLAARNEMALKQLAAELTGRGTDVLHVVADDRHQPQEQAITQTPPDRIGDFDT
jgi:NADP-dependent 3-hydroxy acid dehydrogenase YdfG